MKNVVVFGGGNGLSSLLRGIKDIEVNLTVVVTIADDGGSTGLIRDYYDIPAPGDLRRVVLSLSDKNDLEELMNFRFDDKMDKHTIGNLILVALSQIKGNFSDAVKEYCRILGVKNTVLPLSDESLKLMAKMKSGKLVYGETRIASHDEQVSEISYQGEPKANKDVLNSIKKADYIIFSCGSLYTSIIANLALDDVVEAINSSNSKLIYISNLVTQKGETDNFKLSNHIYAINHHLNDKKIDYVLANNNFDVSDEIIKSYDEENSKLVELDCIEYSEVISDDFLEIRNNHIRHNFTKLNEVLKGVILKDK